MRLRYSDGGVISWVARAAGCLRTLLILRLPCLLRVVCSFSGIPPPHLWEEVRLFQWVTGASKPLTNPTPIRENGKYHDRVVLTALAIHLFCSGFAPTAIQNTLRGTLISFFRCAPSPTVRATNFSISESLTPDCFSWIRRMCVSIWGSPVNVGSMYHVGLETFASEFDIVTPGGKSGRGVGGVTFHPALISANCMILAYSLVPLVELNSMCATDGGSFLSGAKALLFRERIGVPLSSIPVRRFWDSTSLLSAFSSLAWASKRVAVDSCNRRPNLLALSCASLAALRAFCADLAASPASRSAARMALSSNLRSLVSVIPTYPSNTPSSATPIVTSAKPIMDQSGIRFLSILKLTSHRFLLGLVLHHSPKSCLTSGHSNKSPTATMAVETSRSRKHLSDQRSRLFLIGEFKADCADDAEVCRMKASWKTLLAFIAAIYLWIVVDAIRTWIKK